MTAAWVLLMAILSVVGALLSVIYGVKAYALAVLTFILGVFALMLIFEIMCRLDDL